MWKCRQIFQNRRYKILVHNAKHLILQYRKTIRPYLIHYNSVTRELFQEASLAHLSGASTFEKIALRLSRSSGHGQTNFLSMECHLLDSITVACPELAFCGHQHGTKLDRKTLSNKGQGSIAVAQRAIELCIFDGL